MTPGSIYTRVRDGIQRWTSRWLDLGDSRWERELAEARSAAGARPLRHAMAEWSASPASGREHEFRPAHATPPAPTSKGASRPSALPGEDVPAARAADAAAQKRAPADEDAVDEASSSGAARPGWWARLRERRMAKHPALHAYRRLVMRLHLELEGLERGRALMLTSPKANRECAQAARELARHLAEEQDQRVLLVDACVLHPTLSAALEHEGSPGLTSLLDGRADALSSLVVDTAQPGVRFLPAGALERGNAGPMWPEEIEKFVASATAEYDYLLLVCPPVLEDSTAMAFPAAVDFVLLLAVEGDTRKKDLDDAQHTLETCRAKRIGIVLSSAPKRGLFGRWR
jgi:Mrp family chromosome partitioning ATPase